jgi:FKBP-type peptidyl-prolyl cis-trans isomerase FkpA
MTPSVQAARALCVCYRLLVMRRQTQLVVLQRVAVAAAFVAGACASAGGSSPSASGASGGDVVASTRFSPSLDVQLSEMTRQFSGLYVQDFEGGTGPPATSGDLLRVRYTVHLPDGTRAGGLSSDQPPLEFRLGRGQVVKGWDEGLTGMRVNGRRRLVIPPSLGYGSRAQAGIPRNSVMVVDVRLVEIQR